MDAHLVEEDEYYGCIICPEYQILKYSITNRDGYRKYKSDLNICANCRIGHLCTHSKDCVKTLTRHIWADYMELAEGARHTPICQRAYKARIETIGALTSVSAPTYSEKRQNISAEFGCFAYDDICL